MKEPQPLTREEISMFEPGEFERRVDAIIDDLADEIAHSPETGQLSREYANYLLSATIQVCLARGHIDAEMTSMLTRLVGSTVTEEMRRESHAAAEKAADAVENAFGRVQMQNILGR
jgi:hypothetical protein